MYSKNIYCGLNALKTSWNDTSGCTCHRMMQSCCKNPVFIVSFWDVKFLRPNPLWKQFCEEKDAALAHRDNQIEALEFTNEEERQAHQQEILRLNEKISDLIANRHVARCGCFHNVLCLIKKNSGEVHPYYVFDVSIGSWKNISNGLGLIFQTWRWPTNVMIQTQFTDSADLSAKW